MKTFVKVAFAPLVVLSFQLASLFPDLVERWYGLGLYPYVVSGFAEIDIVDFSLAELLVTLLIAAIPLIVMRAIRGNSLRERATRFLSFLWVSAGLAVSSFLLLWGYNYTRAPLSEKLGLSRGEVEARDVLDAGRRVARHTAALYRELAPSSSPSELPLTFEQLDRLVDEGFRALELPGDGIRTDTAPAKPLVSSELFSYLGISGIFIPFTGEPSVNHLQPDVSLPMVLAHEKAHQRGITHEGEASLAAFLVCSRDEAPLYVRYAAFLFATRHLIGEASYYLPEEEVLAAWELLGAGPTEDLIAIREFWKGYLGTASEVAAEVNDRYLRSVGVEEGVQSYGTVVRLLMALDERGELITE